MTKWSELIVAMIALVAIIGSNSAWRFRDISTTTLAMEDDAAAAVARSQALPITHLGPGW
jgi:hypothetical protein